MAFSSGPPWFDRSADLIGSVASGQIRCDIAIVGAGAFGLHLAWQLRDNGREVVLIEGGRIGESATALSTAKVSVQHGTRWSGLVEQFGGEAIRPYALANRTAVDQIGGLLADLTVPVPFARKPAILYTADKDASDILKEMDAGRALGLPYETFDAARMPVPATAALACADQIEIEPTSYCRAIASSLGTGVRVFEQSRVSAIDHGDRITLSGDGFEVSAAQAVIATHLPGGVPGGLSARAFPFAHPVIAFPAPDRMRLEAMFLSAAEPTRSFREVLLGGTPWFILSGQEYRIGNPAEQAHAMEELAGFARETFGVTEPARRWINHDYRSFDRLPLVGHPNAEAPRLFIATGFSAWGFSASWVAAEIVADMLAERRHPCAELLDASRHLKLKHLPRAGRENLQTGAELAAGKLKGATGPDLDDLEPGQGTILRDGLGLIAVSRRADGTLVAVSGDCTHLGCTVRWNADDETWDCPCHGSRFGAGGEVISGPAMAPLGKRDVAEL